MANPASYQLEDNFDPSSPNEGIHKEECDLCGQPYQPDSDSTFETDDMKICSMCTEDKCEELYTQEDQHGKMSMTEDEQAFLEWWERDNS